MSQVLFYFEYYNITHNIMSRGWYNNPLSANFPDSLLDLSVEQDADLSGELANK